MQVAEYVKRARGDWYHDQHQYDRAIDSYKTTIDALTTATALDTQDILDILVTQPTKKLESYELAIATLRDYKHIESAVDLAHFHVLIGLAALGAERIVEAQQHFEKAERNFARYECYSKLTSVNFYLAKVYYLFNNKQKCVSYLKKSLDSLSAQERFNLDWWQPWTVAEMCVVALREGIQIGFVERWMMRRLSEHEAHYFYPLFNYIDPQIQQLALRFVQRFPDSLDIKARQMLENDEILELHPQIKKCFVNWLDSGWLTAYGLIQLNQLFNSAQQIEIFLLWICPRMQGAAKSIAHELDVINYQISHNTVKYHLLNIQKKLKANVITANYDLSGYSLALQWAVHQKIINIHLNC